MYWIYIWTFVKKCWYAELLDSETNTFFQYFQWFCLNIHFCNSWISLFDLLSRVQPNQVMYHPHLPTCVSFPYARSVFGGAISTWQMVHHLIMLPMTELILPLNGYLHLTSARFSKRYTEVLSIFISRAILVAPQPSFFKVLILWISMVCPLPLNLSLFAKMPSFWRSALKKFQIHWKLKAYSENISLAFWCWWIVLLLRMLHSSPPDLS